MQTSARESEEELTNSLSNGRTNFIENVSSMATKLDLTNGGITDLPPLVS